MKPNPSGTVPHPRPESALSHALIAQFGSVESFSEKFTSVLLSSYFLFAVKNEEEKEKEKEKEEVMLITICFL